MYRRVRREDNSWTAIVFLATSIAIAALVVAIVGYQPIGTTVSSTSLEDSGVMAGTYSMPILTVDSKGRITNIIMDDPEINITDTYTVYVDAPTGSDANSGLSPTSPKQTFQAAVGAFNAVAARQCTIIVLNTVDLGTNPNIHFFPATFGCQNIRVQGVRQNVVNDVLTGFVEIGGTPLHLGWSGGNTAQIGGFQPALYQNHFVRFPASGRAYIVLNNSATTFDILHDASADSYVIETLPGARNFTMYTVNSSITWSGPFIAAASQRIDFEDIILRGQGVDTFHVSRTPEQSTYSGVRFEFDSSTDVDLTPGHVSGDNLLLAGCYVDVPAGNNFLGCVNMNSTIYTGGARVGAPQQRQTACAIHFDAVWFQESIELYGSDVNFRASRVEETLFLTFASRVYGQDLFTLNSIIVQSASNAIIGSSNQASLSSITVGDASTLSYSTSNSASADVGLVQVQTGSSLTITSITGSGRFSITDLSRLVLSVGAWTYTGAAPWITIARGARAVYRGLSFATSNLATTANTIPLLDVATGSSSINMAFSGAATMENQNFPGIVVRCGTNAITAHTSASQDLTTNTFCG